MPYLTTIVIVFYPLYCRYVFTDDLSIIIFILYFTVTDFHFFIKYRGGLLNLYKKSLLADILIVLLDLIYLRLESPRNLSLAFAANSSYPQTI
ncbi:hypothetical protein MYVALT_G_00750 [Candidatus Vallotia tarda]|uniref:Uncharacterized protein n=1 Tax=Candidatus Vallotiella hemipterorum TaxID=1177213 RepID=A0A916JRD2_9BURK|nr:hypothetical protein MYVALT_G_00750 [Candidatus Vallotia tarda]